MRPTAARVLRAVRHRVLLLRRFLRPKAPVCHDLKAWASSCIGAEYSVLDDAFTTTRPLPNTIEAEIDESFAPLCSFHVPERALVKVPNGRISGEIGLVVLPDGAFAGELVAMTPAGQITMLRAERAYSEPLPRPVRKRGNYYAVLGLGVQHYYHWTHDIIMRMRGLADTLPTDTQLIVPERMRPFQSETLALLDLDDHPRVPFPPGEVWELENLYLVTPTLKTQIDSPAPYQWLRHAVMERYGMSEQKPSRKLFLSRRHDNHWRATNELDVERVLSRHGFETVAPAELSFRGQAELFAGAGTIVGTGAGLMNMVFSPPGTKILQLQEPEHMVHALWTMAAALDFEYHYFLCEPVPNPGGANADIRVPIEKLEAALASMTAS